MNKKTQIIMLSLVLLIAVGMLAAAAFALLTHRTNDTQDHSQPSLQESFQLMIEEHRMLLKNAEERLALLQSAKRIEFQAAGTRQFDEGPDRKGYFDTKIMTGYIGTRCVLLVNPDLMSGRLSVTLNAAKVDRKPITKVNGSTEYFDVYEAVEDKDLASTKQRIADEHKWLSMATSGSPK